MRLLLSFLLGLMMFGCTTVVIEEAPPFEPAMVEVGEISAETVVDNGFDPDVLAQIPNYIENGYSHLYSVLVLRNGDLVYEWYADGITSDTPAVVWSVTKSVTSSLIGIAIEEGLIDSVDQTLGELIPLRIPLDADPLIQQITVEQLLTMSSGLYCNRDGCHNNSVAQTMAQSVHGQPGTLFVYDTGASHLLAAVLEEATGMSPFDFGSDKLFEPLGFQNISWDTDSNGLNFAGKGLNIRPRDMAKFGQLILNDGEWNGVQLIPANYLHAATVDQLDGIAANGEYGYLWWPGEVDDHDSFAAVGFGGQYITVVPELELVVVITSNYTRPRDGNDNIIRDLIVPAIVD